MSLGKSIRIYLKDGNVSGIKSAEVVNHTIQAMSCPRNKLSELNRDFPKEANRPGVYFLLGEDEENKPKVYIGEAENVWERLKEHGIKKEFWVEVVFYTSKDENLTKAHVKYLESKLVEISKIADRYNLENSNSPSLNSLPLPDKDAMEDFIIYIRLLNGTLGHKFLEPPIIRTNTRGNDNLTDITSTINSSENLELELKIKGINAKALQTDEGIVVLKGSEVANNESSSYNYTVLRRKLISEEVIVPYQADKLIFKEDYLFKSPSAAAAVVLGYSINGRDAWKNKLGKTLNEIEKTKIEFNS